MVLAQARAQALANDSVQENGTFSDYTDLEPADASGYGYDARYLLTQIQYQRADMLSSITLGKASSNAIALAVSGQMKGDPNRGIDLLIHACKLDPEDAESHSLPRGFSQLLIHLISIAAVIWPATAPNHLEPYAIRLEGPAQLVRPPFSGAEDKPIARVIWLANFWITVTSFFSLP